METKVKQLKVVNKPPSPPCIWFQVPLSDVLNDFRALEGATLDDYTLTLTKRRKRSLTANAYMWQLCEKIAKKINVTKEDVYRKAIREVGAFTDGIFSRADVEKIQTNWSNNGIGWFAESHGMFGDMVTVRLYQGSHIYDGDQMRRLVDYIVGEAKDLGIETMTPDEIERLKQLWAEKVT